MADEKTEAATPKRRDTERNKGNISKSQDLNSALALSIGVALLAALFPGIMESLQSLMFQTFTHLNPKDISTDNLFSLLAPYIIAAGRIVLPFLLTLMLFAALVIRLQIGHILAWEKLKPDITKLSPQHLLTGLKKTLNVFSMQSIVELLKNLVKVIIVGNCGYSAINARKDELFSLIGVDVHAAFMTLGSILFQMLINMCVAMLILGLIDKKYQDYQYEKSLKMSKQEVKDEAKNADGDPEIKARIRSAQMQIMRQKMMSAIPTADVVVTNPTHFAVALKYDKSVSPAPMVVAKGADFMAFKIREIAQNNNIPIIENKPLARSLYKLVPVDGVIPAELYVAVAEVLAYVYNKNKTGV